VVAVVFLTFLEANAQITLLAVGSLTGSSADLSGLNNTLENGVSASLLGGLGSGLAWEFGNTFLAVPDRGPNIRLSSDGRFVYVSDEYGPYVYEFMRSTGQSIRTFTLPENLFVANLRPVGNDEIAANTSGRVANKGMEGLAITPDGKTLVGILQNALTQDAAQGGAAANLLRIITIDVATGRATH